MAEDQTPDAAINDRGPGDDTFRRYRYQATYAAILALRMLHRNSEIVEVFCEHHDDILVKYKSGRFHALQVKTQQPGENPFKASDEEVKTALGKFVLHEMKYGASFQRYTIATNHHFYKKDNKASLFFLIEKAQQASGTDPQELDRGLSGFINSLLRTVNEGRHRSDQATREHALSVLRKLHLDHDLPKFQGIHRELREAIVNADAEYRASTYADLERAANALAQMTYQKSSLPSNDASYLYLLYTDDPKKAGEETMISGKRITRFDGADLLAREMTDRPTLTAADPVDPSTLPRDLSVADRKMTAGGLSATTVAAARDWQASAELLQRQWAAKYGEQPAIERYHCVATAVQTACSEAHEATRCDDSHR